MAACALRPARRGARPLLGRWLSTAVDIPLYSERLASPGAEAGPTPDTRTMCVVHGVLGTGRNLATFTRNLLRQAEEATGRPWQAVLLDQRCHGRSASVHSRPPNTLLTSAQDISSLFRNALAYADRPDVLIGHSLGGKVCLELTRYIADAGRAPPAQTWVLDALPFLADPTQTSSGVADTFRTMERVASVPQPLPSREALYAELEKMGFSKAIQLWLGSNLRQQTRSGGPGLYWVFDLAGAREMLVDYCKKDYSKMLANPPPGTDFHIVRAMNSDRWAQADIRRLKQYEAQLSQPTPDRDTTHYHELPNAGHWVHVDNPQGVMDLIVPALVRRNEGAGPPAHTKRVKEVAEASWKQLDEWAHRQLAQAGAGGSGVVPHPSVTQAADGTTTVALALPEGSNPQRAFVAVRSAVARPHPGSRRHSVTDTSGLRGGHYDAEIRRVSDVLGPLTVRLTRDLDGASVLEFTGPLTEPDLQLLMIAAQAACAGQGWTTPSRDPHVFVWDDEDEFGLGVRLPGLGAFLQHMQEMARDFQALGAEDLIGPEEERDAAPFFPPKRFDAVAPRAAPESTRDADEAAAEKLLVEHGATVVHPGPPGSLDWGSLAGYDEQKRQIEDTILLSLLRPEVYRAIAAGTRRQPVASRPRAVLFEGPPGTGKTSSARVIATQAGVPLVYLPLEAIVSKWYGEAEKRLAALLTACEAFRDGCIIFLDEVDSLATARGEGMHEATRRTLGVLLRHLDGFDADKRTVVIAATNRRADLDAALLSRFATSVHFGLPGPEDRARILEHYAKQLPPEDLRRLAEASPGLAGRDLRDICEQAERRWASKTIRGEVKEGTLPDVEAYLEAAAQRLREKAVHPTTPWALGAT